MWNGFCGEIIRRTNQRLLFVVLAALACLLIFLGLNRAYFLGFFVGPHAVSASDLLAAHSSKDFSNAMVTVNGGLTSGTGMAEYTKDDAHPDGFVSARYLATDIDGKQLLVRVDPNTPLALDSGNDVHSQASAKFTGSVHAFSDKTSALVEKANQDGGNYLPYYVDAYEYKTFGWVSVVIGAIVLLWAAWAAMLYGKRNANPAEHPFAKDLARYGALESIVPQLDAEISAAHTTVGHAANTVHVTTNWYIVVSPFRAKAARLSALAWVYKKIIKRKIYLIIPAGTQQLLMTYDRTGRQAAVSLKPAQMDELLLLLRNVAPQAIYGYDKRVFKLWQSGKRESDRTAFMVEARALLAGQPLPEALITSRYR